MSNSSKVGPVRGWHWVLVACWALLLARIVVALARGEPLRDDLALPTIALIVTSALIGSKLYSLLLGRRERGREGASGGATP